MGIFITHVAQGLGFDVECFTRARDFLAALDRATPHVVMIDIDMPGMDGLDLIDKMAEQGLKAFVFIQSGFDRSSLEKAMNLGTTKGLNMAGLIPKPVRAADLRTLLSRYA